MGQERIRKEKHLKPEEKEGEKPQGDITPREKVSPIEREKKRPDNDVSEWPRSRP